MAKTMKLTLNVWRQSGPKDTGRFERYEAKNVGTVEKYLIHLVERRSDEVAVPVPARSESRSPRRAPNRRKRRPSPGRTG